MGGTTPPNVTATTTPQGSSGLPFLAFSRTGVQEMQGSPGTYATGTTLTFESQAGIEGMAEAIEINLSLAVTPTISGSNKMVQSPFRSWFTRLQIQQGGQTFRDIHPFFYILRRGLTRPLEAVNYLNTNYGQSWTENQYAKANLPTSSLASLANSTAVTENFTWYVPLRWLRGSTAGMFPIGDSSIPLRLILTTPAAMTGSDPEANPYLIHSGSGDSVAIGSTKSVSVRLYYRAPLVYAGAGTVGTPVVGTQLMHTQQSIAFTSTGADLFVPHKNLYPTTMSVSVIEDGNADPNATSQPGNQLGLLAANYLNRYRFRLTDTDPVDDIDTATKFEAWFSAWRRQLGFDLPDGVFPFVPYLGFINSGGYDVANLEIMHQFPNFKVWQNAQTIFNVTSGTSLNGAGSGLSRITEFSEYLVSVPY